MVIDNKWATEMIIQMYHLVQKKNYHFCCKNRDLDKDQEYNRFKESIMTKNIKNQSINLDWFFEYKDYKEKKQELEDDNPGQNFISFIRIFSLYEKNDSFTFSKEYCDFSTVSHYLNEFSNKQSFNSLCRFVYLTIELNANLKKIINLAIPSGLIMKVITLFVNSYLLLLKKNYPPSHYLFTKIPLF